ncbi:MAG: hypothetical protein HDQ88_09560 [Clostridia bacterium]|nr:hypothetical protein [Clostridia bacterium]
MKLIDTSIKPPECTWRYKFCRWFCDNINICHGQFYDRVNPENPEFLLDKPENKIYNFFYEYWLFPFKQNNCICCNTVRGLVYGGILGYILRSLI